MVQCITSTRMTMYADVLRHARKTEFTVPLEDTGQHRKVQNTRTGAIQREWVPVVNSDDDLWKVKCHVSGILDGGIRVAGTTERFDKKYANVDFAHMWYPAKYVLSKRDRITNVRKGKNGNIIWLEEEMDYEDEDGAFPATVFNILGITPVTDPFGNHIENRALLARADLRKSE